MGMFEICPRRMVVSGFLLNSGPLTSDLNLYDDLKQQRTSIIINFNLIALRKAKTL